jgi:hypothetical protein
MYQAGWGGMVRGNFMQVELVNEDGQGNSAFRLSISSTDSIE